MINCELFEGIMNMKTIGMIGGMSWESSAEYYRIANQAAKERLGGLHSAKILMHSLDFAEIEEMQVAGRWDELAAILAASVLRLETGGADFAMICTNTMHRDFEIIAAATRLPMLHIADATGTALKNAGIRKTGLLGTKFTMEQDFYKERIRRNFGIETVIPGNAAREKVHRIIYDELCKGIILDESREEFKVAIHEMVNEGAEGVILGCTEIPLLIKSADSPVPVFDTTSIHARAAVEMALA